MNISRNKSSLPRDAKFFGDFTTYGGKRITDYATALKKAEEVDMQHGPKWYNSVIVDRGGYYAVEEYYKANN